MKLGCARRDVEPTRDFLVRVVLEEQLQNLIFTATQRRTGHADGRLQPVLPKRLVDEARQKGSRAPEGPGCERPEGLDQTTLDFRVVQDAPGSQSKERKRADFVQVLGKDQYSCSREPSQDLGNQILGFVPPGRRVDDIDGRTRYPELIAVRHGRRIQSAGHGAERMGRDQLRKLSLNQGVKCTHADRTQKGFSHDRPKSTRSKDNVASQRKRANRVFAPSVRPA